MNWYQRIVIAQNKTVIDLNNLELVDSLGGSTGAMLMRDRSTDELYVLKRGAHPEQAQTEYDTNKFLGSLGVPVPESYLQEDEEGFVYLTKFIKGQPLWEYLEHHPEQEDRIKTKLRDHFSGHALVGNWDVIGLEDDNVLVDDEGNPYYIDLGGSGPWRAQGDPKGEAWNDEVGEVDTLREFNPRYFSDVSDDDIRNQFSGMNIDSALQNVQNDDFREMLRRRYERMRGF